MKIKILFTVLVLSLMIGVFGQIPVIELTFTAIDSLAYIQLDSIKVMNKTQGCDTVLFYPDTVLVLDYQVEIPIINSGIKRFQVFQNYPNPVTDQTTISIFVPEKDEVGIIITDMLGRIILKSERVMDKGFHFFKFAPGNGSLFLFTAYWKGSSSNIKILQASPNLSVTCLLEYLGCELLSPQLKITENIQSFFFSIGDEFIYIGYIDTLQSRILDVPENNEDYTFQFATNIPCPGTPMVIYEGQEYNTIQIFSQCWFKENLNVGTMINGNDEMENNDILEKYCYYNEPDSCTKYGGLYQWDKMMQYTTQQGVQGVCPQGWHLPSDEEWKVLEGSVDSQYNIGDPEWDGSNFWNGYDVGLNIKSINYWYSGGNGTDIFGFSALPGGYFNMDYFDDLGYYGYWWSTTEYNSFCAFIHFLNFYYNKVAYGFGSKALSLSVRCIKD